MPVRVQRSMIPTLMAVVAEAADVGIRVQFSSGYRSLAKQRALYAAWIRAGKKGYTVAPPGRSLHNYGLAVDFTTVPRGLASLRTVGRIAERHGLRWGGRFNPPDPIHLDVGLPSGAAAGAAIGALGHLHPAAE